MALMRNITVIVIAVVAYWLNQPLPPNTANILKYKALGAMLKIHMAKCQIESWWTGEDFRIVEQNRLANRFTENLSQDPDVQLKEDNFDGVKVYIFQPNKKASGRPALLYMHGGGFLTGHPVMQENIAKVLVKEMGMVVVSPRYRLSPKFKAPTQHKDCLKVAKFMFQKAEMLGIDNRLIGVAGESAGGNLAASLSLTFRDQGTSLGPEGHQFSYQLLIYPWLQGLDMATPSYQQNCKDALVIMTCDAMATYLGSFLGVPPEIFPDLLANKHVGTDTWERHGKLFKTDEIPTDGVPQDYRPLRPTEINEVLAAAVEKQLTDPLLFPLLASNLSNLPPAYVSAVANDPIRDEAIWFANRLRREGTPVHLDYSPDGFHGMISLNGAPFVFDAAMKAQGNMILFVRDILDKKSKEIGDKSTK